LSEAYKTAINFDSQILLRPLSRQLENGVAIIGRHDQFLELPTEGLDFLDWLNQGLSLGQARDRFEAQHNPFPDDDVIDVVNAFFEYDFIAAVDGQPIFAQAEASQLSSPWFSRQWARMIFSQPVLLGWIAFVLPAAVLWVFTPDLWPRRADYFWIDFNFMIILVGMLVWLGGMALHELSHWLACQAKGIAATVTWTQRLGFMPMSQTIMHNIWAVPRTARFLPISAGMIWDIFGISVVLYLLLFNQFGVLVLPALVIKFLKFYLLVSAMALTAQFWLFSKMDGYFLLSSLLGQRNLQADTYHWITAKFLRRDKRFTPPAGGMKMVYIYGLITILWGSLFVGQFLLINIPIQLQLLWESLLKIGGGVGIAPLEFADGVAVVTSQFVYWGLLIYAYWRDTIPNWRQP